MMGREGGPVGLSSDNSRFWATGARSSSERPLKRLTTSEGFRTSRKCRTDSQVCSEVHGTKTNGEGKCSVTLENNLMLQYYVLV